MKAIDLFSPPKKDKPRVVATSFVGGQSQIELTETQVLTALKAIAGGTAVEVAWRIALPLSGNVEGATGRAWSVGEVETALQSMGGVEWDGEKYVEVKKDNGVL